MVGYLLCNTLKISDFVFMIAHRIRFYNIYNFFRLCVCIFVINFIFYIIKYVFIRFCADFVIFFVH